MTTEIGMITIVERPPHGPWTRVTLNTGKRVYLHERDCDRIRAEYGTERPAVRFAFEIDRLWRKVSGFEALDATPAATEAAGVAQERERHDLSTRTFYALRDELAKRGSNPLAPGLERMTEGLIRHNLAGGFCMREKADPAHGVRHCTEPANHGGPHRIICMQCDLVDGLLQELGARLE